LPHRRWYRTLLAYKQRTRPTSGLIETVEDTCERFRIDTLLIEAKASGISAYGRTPADDR
jgi:hypothetical protein